MRWDSITLLALITAALNGVTFRDMVYKKGRRYMIVCESLTVNSEKYRP